MNILFITTAFSPENAMGAVRTTKFVKYLVKNNYKVTVVSPEMHSGSKTDYSLECDELTRVNRILIPQSSIFSSLFLRKRNKMLEKKSATDYLKTADGNKLLSKVKSQFFICLQFLYTLLRNEDWYLMVLKTLNKNLEVKKFDVIISSYPSLGAHWSAKKISKKHGIKWIADFRDPVNYEGNSNRVIFNIAEHIQNSILKQAHQITYVTEEMIGRLNKTAKFNSEKFNFLPNGFDPLDDSSLKNESELVQHRKLVVSYMGSLYGGKRDLEIIFKAIRQLIDDHSITENQLVFYYAGKEFNVLKSQAIKYKLEELIVDRGFVSREESIKIQKESDIIVVATWNSNVDSGIIPGKIYECFLLKKVILGVVNGNLSNSEMKKLILNVNGGFTYEDASIDKEKDFVNLMDFIKEKVNEKRDSGQVESKYNNEITKYEYSYLTEKLIGIINN